MNLKPLDISSENEINVNNIVSFTGKKVKEDKEVKNAIDEFDDLL